MAVGQRTHIGPYEVRAPLGSGGMGVVYRAYDPRLQRDVALKVLPAALTNDPIAKRQLLDEARAAAALNHPNICTVHEVGDAGGQAFVAMELVPGESLSAQLARDTVDPAKVIWLGVQLAAALEHGHRNGVVHRDLKSANIIVTPDGRAKVVDFGLATRHAVDYDAITRSDVLLEHAGPVAGTLPYMAPEVVRGVPANARSDIWALGVVLYEMVAGRLPFTGATTADLTSAILRDPPAPLPPGTPIPLAAVVRRCLEKEPLERYERAGEVRAALELIRDEASAASGLISPRSTAARRWRGVAGLGALVALLSAAAGAAIVMLRDPEPAAPAAFRGRSIAVLPFDNLSNDPAQDYFSDGMTEALITDLAKISALKVISRTSIMRYKGAERKPLPEIARELKVDTVIEGAVLTAAGRVRVSVNVVDGPSDRQLWTDSFERELRDTLVLQSEIARAVAYQVRAQLSGLEAERLANAKPIDPRAHELYLRGRYLTHRSVSDALNRAVDYLQQTIQIEPGFAPAYAALARAHQQREVWGGIGIGASGADARAAAEKAVALDDTLAEAHLALGIVHFNHDWDWDRAEAAFQRTLRLNASLPDTYMHRAYLLQALGRHDDAINEIRRAVELDPGSAAWLSDEGRMLYRARRFEEAIERYRRTLELDPVFLPPLTRMAEAYEHLGRFDDALATLKRLEKIEGRQPLRALARLYARMGRVQESMSLARRIEREGDLGGGPYALASIYLALGEVDRALGQLERGARERTVLPFQLRDPNLDPVKDHDRYRAIMRAARLPL